MKKNAIVVLVLLCIYSRVAGQEVFADPGISIAENISELTKQYAKETYHLFDLHIATAQLRQDQDSIVSRATYYSLNQAALQEICNTAPILISMQLTGFDGEVFDVTLARYDIFTPDFKSGFIEENTYQHRPFERGVYYRGIIEGYEGWASFSFNSKEVQGLIAKPEGNWILGALKKSSDYIFYNDAHLKRQGTFACSAGAEGVSSGDKLLTSGGNNKPTQLCDITVFWVADYDFFTVSNYDLQMALFNVSGIFNNVAALYQNEGLTVKLSETYVHTLPDGYSKLDFEQPFKAFGYNIHNSSNFDESLAMLLAVGGVGQAGGVGVIDALCASYNPALQFSGGRYAYSRIEPYYYNVPTFSNTIAVVTHEMGHNVGSRHTHWCGWPGGAIDNCVATPEPDPFGNGCLPGPFPSNGGTIMSYCALSLGSIPLLNGFGYYPHQEIIKDVNAASHCLCKPNSVKAVVQDQTKLELYPNPATAEFEIRSDGNALSDKVPVLTIYNAYGQLVLKAKEASTINVAHLDAGIYFIMTEINGQKIARKLIKQ